MAGVADNRRRSSDRGWRRLVRENWYRDVWLLAITIVALAGTIVAVNGANEARDATREIQAQRIETIWSSCRQQNARHDGTIRELNVLLRASMRTADPARRQQLSASRASTVLLINQLAPKQDCAMIVKRATQTPVSLPPIQSLYPPVLTNRSQ